MTEEPTEKITDSPTTVYDDLAESIMLALGYRCQLGQPLAAVAAQHGRSGELGHNQDKPGAYLLQVTYPGVFDNPVKVMACADCRDAWTAPEFAENVPGLIVALVGGPIGESQPGDPDSGESESEVPG